MEDIVSFYETFYKKSKEREIEIIKNALNEYKNKTISEIMEVKDFFEKEKDFNLEEAIENCKNLEYKDSLFFMSIFNKVNNKVNSNIFNTESEEEIFKLSLDNYESCLTRIINQKETNEPFFKIDNVDNIIEVTKKNIDNIKEFEINFISKKFQFLEKDEYIKNDLINDIINFSKKDEILELLKGIIKFIDIINKFKNLKQTNFFEKIKKINETITSENVNGKEIQDSIMELKEFGFDINTESNAMKFLNLLKKIQSCFLKK